MFSVERALAVLAGSNVSERGGAIRVIYSRDEFTGEERRLAQNCLARWPEWHQASGAIYYILESSPHFFEFYLSPEIRKEIARSWSGCDFDAPVWNGETFVVWSCGSRETRLLSEMGVEDISSKARKISLDLESLGDLHLVMRVLRGLDDFMEISDEVACAFCDRVSFAESEIEVAKRFLTEFPHYSNAAETCLHVLKHSLRLDDLEAFIEGIEVRRGRWGRYLRRRATKANF